MEKLLAALGLEKLPSAVMWDMDGTLLDTFDPWIKKTSEVVKANGGDWTEADAKAVFGSSIEVYSQHMVHCVERVTGVAVPAMPMFREVVNFVEAEVYPNPKVAVGAAEVKAAFRKAGVPQALVTASQESLAKLALAATGIVFDAVVTGTDDVPGKPAPDPYLLGAQRLGVDITKALVFEDSPLGIQAAVTAGAVAFNVSEVPFSELAKLLG
ncbi:MAG: HAD family phosphatase [Arcanobacterium sp.]|nr:HAD family phosphatase [Arcanobacterium sp.]